MTTYIWFDTNSVPIGFGSENTDEQVTNVLADQVILNQLLQNPALVHWIRLTSTNPPSLRIVPPVTSSPLSSIQLNAQTPEVNADIVVFIDTLRSTLNYKMTSTKDIDDSRLWCSFCNPSDVLDVLVSVQLHAERTIQFPPDLNPSPSCLNEDYIMYLSGVPQDTVVALVWI